MIPRLWFIYESGRIAGPVIETELKQRIANLAKPLVWCRGQSEWIESDRVERLLWDLQESDRAAQKQPPDRLWKIKIRGVELPRMFNQEGLIEQLKNRQDHKEILLWTEGYSEWKQIYEIHKLLDQLGVSRRAHPRVPITGVATLDGPAGSQSANVLSISEGGLGLNDIPGIRIGERFRVTLKSSNLFSAVHASGEVVYVSQDGYVGMKFTGIHPESKAAIIEYVKKFAEQAASN